MQTDELRGYLNAQWQTLRKEILEGNYKPQPVRKVEIPKPQGGARMLGIPTLLSLCEYLYKPSYNLQSLSNSILESF